MKTLKNSLLVVFLAILTFISMSWDKSKNHNAFYSSSAYDAIFSASNSISPYRDFEDLAEDTGSFFSDDNQKRIPPAEDVMVQKIPGDNYHLLIMAVYSYASYSGRFISVDNGGEQIQLRDDGKEYDKVAGDGVFTSIMFTDVKEFRKLAVSMLPETIKNNWQPLFPTRDFKYASSCNSEPFSEAKFDSNQPVSISSLAPSGNSVTDRVRKNCIFLTDISVVEDTLRTWNPCTQKGNVDGAWTFKTLMKNLATKIPSQPANDQKLSDFVKKWLNSWSTEQILNTDTVAARTLVKSKILNPWLSKSLAAGNPSGMLDFHFAPFKLTAIVNRFDIRTRASGIPAGEGRFTFCLINSDCNAAENFTVVIEYGIPKPDVCDSLQNWALQWFNLKDLVLGSPTYLSALQAITDQYTLCGTNPNKINQSCLDAVRTNDFALADQNPPRWEFREFGLVGSNLTQRLVSQVPADRYNAQVDNPDVRRMVKFVNENSTGIIADDYIVPGTYDSFPLLGGKSTILDTPVGLPTQPYHWDGVEVKKSPAFITTTSARHIFSRNTCSGCHAGEVQTFFTHVDPVFFGTAATLSGFLTGTAGRGGAVDADGDPNNDNFLVRDAAARGNVNADRFHGFNDILRRAQDLKQVATAPPCGSPFTLRNTLMFHPISAPD